MEITRTRFLGEFACNGSSAASKILLTKIQTNTIFPKWEKQTTL